ncbi:uncharacterized protein LOC128254697 isoform X2 [Drosophila gunungcola]|uniref:Uncharacterized protein n=1 Tax=Drosophila gunungcola TaxID=103775 RepID=A0A9P9YKR5_9MUSC|nr:uncharacterized protein LOC128254697 isoform X2 [Drosophila gunungcola]KAI8038793.1 hypothetical protein M5D96_008701 [Drosophila gunungcola]
MFALVRLLSRTRCNRMLQSQVLCHESVKKIYNSSPKICPTLRDFSFLRTRKIFYRLPLQRLLSDKLTEKGRGDELNYFLKLGHEQFMKIRKNRIQEISNEIEALQDEIKKLEKQTSRKAMKTREDLSKQINHLREMLERFENTIKKESE